MIENRYTECPRLFHYTEQGNVNYLPVMRPTITQDGNILRINFKNPNTDKVKITDKFMESLKEEAERLYPEFSKDKIIVSYS